MNKKKSILPILILLLGILISCNNPFAPKLANVDVQGQVIKNQKTIEEVFENFRYSYVFKDTVVYGNLFAADYIFVYPDYDKGVDVTWGRDEDMRATSKMFEASRNLDLIWHDVMYQIGDSVSMVMNRGYSLNITFSPTDIVNLQGWGKFELSRNLEDSIWRIEKWRDMSNF